MKTGGLLTEVAMVRLELGKNSPVFWSLSCVVCQISSKLLGLLSDNLRTLIVFVDELQDVRNLFLLRIVGSLLRQASLFHRVDVRLVITLRARPKWKCQNVLHKSCEMWDSTQMLSAHPLEERLWNEHKQQIQYVDHTDVSILAL